MQCKNIALQKRKPILVQFSDNPQIPKKWRYFWNTIQKIGDNFGIRALLHRNREAEGEAVGLEMVGGNGPAVEGNSVLHNGQTQAGTLGAVRILLRDTVETLENLSQMLIAHPFAGIIVEKVRHPVI